MRARRQMRPCAATFRPRHVANRIFVRIFFFLFTMKNSTRRAARRGEARRADRPACAGAWAIRIDTFRHYSVCEFESTSTSWPPVARQLNLSCRFFFLLFSLNEQKKKNPKTCRLEQFVVTNLKTKPRFKFSMQHFSLQNRFLKINVRTAVQSAQQPLDTTTTPNFNISNEPLPLEREVQKLTVERQFLVSPGQLPSDSLTTPQISKKQ
jgi:hypothetical protein